MAAQKHGHVDRWEIVQDERGRILGKAWSASPLLREQVAIVREFLIKISNRKDESVMSKKAATETDHCNMVFLAGAIKSLKVRDDGSAFLLIDPGGESKYLPCTVFENKELTRMLERYREDDLIKVRGYARAWSQKKEGVWVNKVEIRITEIKGDPPKREAKQSNIADDDIPF